MPASLFVVRRKTPPELPSELIPEPHQQYAATFADSVAADEYALRLDRADKADPPGEDVNPFKDARYDELTSLPPFALRDFLRDAGIEPPPQLKPKATQHQEREAWSEWWTRAMVANDLTPSQWQRVWEGLNLHRYFEVVEVDAEGLDAPKTPKQVYAVVKDDWEYNDYLYSGSHEALAVYRTKAAATAEAERRRAEPEDEWDNARYVVIALPFSPEE